MTATPGASVTQISLPDHVLCYSHKHGRDMYAATGENVLNLVKQVATSCERLKAAVALLDQSTEGPAIRDHRWLWRAMEEILANNPERPTTALNRLFYGKPDAEAGVTIDPAWAKELLTWFVLRDNAEGFEVPRKAVSTLASTGYTGQQGLDLSQAAYAELPFLAPVRDRVGSVVFMSADTLSQADELRNLLRDNWKPEAMEDPKRAFNILGRYIRFMNETVGDFELERVAPKVPNLGFCVG